MQIPQQRGGAGPPQCKTPNVAGEGIRVRADRVADIAWHRGDGHDPQREGEKGRQSRRGSRGEIHQQTVRHCRVRNGSTHRVLGLIHFSQRNRLVRSQMASGKRPAVWSVETCARTFGLLGAESSLSTSHLGAPPVWVIATIQPAGTAPTVMLSKLMLSARPIEVTASGSTFSIAVRGFKAVPL